MKALLCMQREFAEALKQLIEVEYDVIEAYELAINNLSNTAYQAQFIDFSKDHLKYIEKLSQILGEHGRLAPNGSNNLNQQLTKGKTIINTLVGDEVILEAMRMNETDVDAVYERISNRSDIWQDANVVIVRGWTDIKRHRTWFDNVLNGFMLEKTE